MIPGSGRSPGEGHGSPLRCPCLESFMDRGAWRAALHGVTESDRSERLTLTFAAVHGNRTGGLRRLTPAPSPRQLSLSPCPAGQPGPLTTPHSGRVSVSLRRPRCSASVHHPPARLPSPVVLLASPPAPALAPAATEALPRQGPHRLAHSRSSVNACGRQELAGLDHPRLWLPCRAPGGGGVVHRGPGPPHSRNSQAWTLDSRGGLWF